MKVLTSFDKDSLEAKDAADIKILATYCMKASCRTRPFPVSLDIEDEITFRVVVLLEDDSKTRHSRKDKIVLFTSYAKAQEGDGLQMRTSVQESGRRRMVFFHANIVILIREGLNGGDVPDDVFLSVVARIAERFITKAYFMVSYVPSSSC